MALVLQGITLGLKNFSSEPIIDDEELEEDDWSMLSEPETANEYSETGSELNRTGSNLKTIKNEKNGTEKTSEIENDIEMVKIESDSNVDRSEIETWTISLNHEVISKHQSDNQPVQDLTAILPSPSAPPDDHMVSFCQDDSHVTNEPPDNSLSPENQHILLRSPCSNPNLQKPKPKPIPILYKQKYAAVFVQKGRTRESKQEIQEMYKRDFPEIFPNTKYEKMSR